MPVRNKTRNISLGNKILTINSNFRKTLRLLNRKGIPDDCFLWISPCHGIYTTGMKNPVDIVFLDKERKIVKMLRNFPPNCFADSVPTATSAIEFPSGRLADTGTGIGDIIELDHG